MDYVKAFDCVDHNKLWKIMKENRRLWDKIRQKLGGNQVTCEKIQGAQRPNQSEIRGYEVKSDRNKGF